MTARESTTVIVDAATVYAEGMYAGLKDALRLILRTKGATVPLSLRRQITEWEAHVIHREWLAEQGRAIDHATSAETLARIHLVLQAAGLRSSD